MDYKYIYDKLYEIGYHDKGKNHGCNYIRYFINNYKFNRILEVGCSNGRAVRDMQKKGKGAYGIDISPIAIRYATEKYAVRNCIEGSACDIPFKDNFFDAVFSCDVLEHLAEEDAIRAIHEIHRVCTGYIFLKISPELEQNRSMLDKAKELKLKHFDNIENLHITVKPIEWWIEQITFCKRVYFEKNIGNLLIFRVR